MDNQENITGGYESKNQHSKEDFLKWADNLVKNADKEDRSLLTSYPVDDPRLLEDVVAENRLSFPIIIEAPDHVSQDNIDEEVLPTYSDYIEQRIAAVDALLIGEEISYEEHKFFHRYSTAYKFNFHYIYFEAYNALKAYDKDNNTQLATLYIESLMSLGTKGIEESDNPIIQAALSGAKFLISQERNKQESTRLRNEKRSDDNKDDHLGENLSDLL